MEWRAWEAPESLKCMHVYAFVLISFVEWGAWEGSESLKMQRFPYMFHEFFGGVGSMGRPIIVENINVSIHVSLFL